MPKRSKSRTRNRSSSRDDYYEDEYPIHHKTVTTSSKRSDLVSSSYFYAFWLAVAIILIMLAIYWYAQYQRRQFFQNTWDHIKNIQLPTNNAVVHNSFNRPRSPRYKRDSFSQQNTMFPSIVRKNAAELKYPCTLAAFTPVRDNIYTVYK